MDHNAHKVTCILVDIGSTMADLPTKTITNKCMATFFANAKKNLCKTVYELATFNRITKNICDFTLDIDDLYRKYQNTQIETFMCETPGFYSLYIAKYRKCINAIQFCANNLISKAYRFPNAIFNILVITDGTVDQSDEFTVCNVVNQLIWNKIHLDFVITNGWVSPVLSKLSKCSGGSIYQISNDKDINTIFGDPAFYDLRIRNFKKMEIFKLTQNEIGEWDKSDEVEIDERVGSIYENQNACEESNNEEIDKKTQKINKYDEQIRNKINDIKKLIQKIPNATIILLIGPTGTGKSTFMHTMNEKRMCKMKHHNKTVLNLENMDIKDINSPIGHSAVSKTRTVNFMYSPKLNIIFIDCPGFFDSAGPEQNIINSIAMNQVFNSNHYLKMKVLALVSIEDIRVSRSGVIVKALNMIYRLIPNEEVLKKCLGIVITKGEQKNSDNNIEVIKSIIESESKTINSEWNLIEFLKYLYNNKRFWNFPMPEKEFQSGLYNNFPDSNKIINFITHNPVINPPHSIPLGIDSFEKISDILQKIGNCDFLVSNLFDRILLECYKWKMNPTPLKCWRSQISKIDTFQINSLSKLSSQIEAILPFPQNYSAFFKPMKLLSIFQSFIRNLNEDKTKKQDVINSMNSLQKDFFNKQVIIDSIQKCLKGLDCLISEAEREEKEFLKKRNDYDIQNEEFIRNERRINERISRAEESANSIQISMEYEKRLLDQKKADLKSFRKRIQDDYTNNYNKLATQIQINHSEWIREARNKIWELQRQINEEMCQNQRLRASKY